MTPIRRLRHARRPRLVSCTDSRTAASTALALIRGDTLPDPVHAGEAIAAAVSALWELRNEVPGLIQAEREACAKVCEDVSARLLDEPHDPCDTYAAACTLEMARGLAAAIRGRV
jgi:hypothetical protein